MAFDPAAVLGGGTFFGAQAVMRPIRSGRGLGTSRRTIQTDIGDGDDMGKDYVSRIFFIILSAFIFISVISLFEVARVYINNYYSKDLDENIENGEEERVRERERRNSLKSILVFAIFALLLSFAGGAALLAVIMKNEEKEKKSS